MSAAISWQSGEIGLWADATAFSRAARLALLILSGIAVYGIALLLGGLRRRHLEKGAH
jgi:peptidoglycan biosynthesis protein MviN/MurJ (putative lipid II flippase)